jgi:2-hydroxychromene-2-carboxylate isomerase
MTKKIDFYFDFGSPTTYLAWTQLPKIAKEAGATLIYRPVLLGGIFQATGNKSPAEVPSKGAWTKIDLLRFAARYGVPFAHNPHFPINTLHLMRGAIGFQLRKPTEFESYLATIFHAMWVDGLDLGNQAILAEVLQGGGVDPQEFLSLVNDADIKTKLKQDTEAAVERGLFGAPTIFVGDEMFFGQDRLDFAREALR